MLEASRISREDSQARPVRVLLTLLAAATLGLTVGGCHSATNSNSTSSPLAAWPQSPFTSQHAQVAKAVKNDPFPDANQPLPPLNANVGGGK